MRQGEGGLGTDRILQQVACSGRIEDAHPRLAFGIEPGGLAVRRNRSPDGRFFVGRNAGQAQVFSNMGPGLRYQLKQMPLYPGLCKRGNDLAVVRVLEAQVHTPAAARRRSRGCEGAENEEVRLKGLSRLYGGI